MAITITPVLANVIVSLRTSFATVLPTLDTYLGEAVSDDTPDNFVMIGSDGNPDSEAQATFEHSWVDLGQTRKRESGSIPCAIISQTGEDDPVSTIVSASATLSACVSDLASDQSLGGICMSSQVTTGNTTIIKNNRGTAVILPFTVEYWAHV